MTATRDDLITQLRRTIADLDQRLESSTAELSENKERYALVSQAVAEGVYDWNIERNALWVSPRLIEIFGLQGPGRSAADWNARVHPDDFENYRAALRNCFKGATARLVCEYRIRLTNGEYRWVEDHGLPVQGAGGRVVRLVGAVGDITERKETERALRASEERHALAMQAINEAVFEWDIRTGNVYFAPRLHQVLGLAPEELQTGADWSAESTPTICLSTETPTSPFSKATARGSNANTATSIPTGNGTGRARMASRCSTRPAAPIG
jgi:PAS domain S-box-containing protein